MVNPKSKIGHNKKNFLDKPVEHIDITSFDSRKIIDSMSKMSFASRDTAKASEIFGEMLKDKGCSIFLTLAGSTSAGGCMQIYSDLAKYNMVDAIVATGASIIDMDFFEALGFKHYQGSKFQDIDRRHSQLRIQVAHTQVFCLGQYGFPNMGHRDQCPPFAKNYPCVPTEQSVLSGP